MAMFSAQEQQRIEAAIEQVEKSTAGEIVIVTARQSDGYTTARLATAVAVALGAGAVAHFVWPELTVGLVLSLELVAGALAFWLSCYRPILRLLIPARAAQTAVERAAELAFLEHAVFQTRDRTGVVILLSELERRVAILGDQGIHACLEKKGWRELVDHIVQSIHQGRASEGVCEVIARLGETLTQHSPVRADDQNELSNRVRQT